jgi:hypothetical protein
VGTWLLLVAFAGITALGTRAPVCAAPANGPASQPSLLPWRRIASTSPAALAPRFGLGGQTRQIPDDLNVILDHYRTRASYPYGLHWMKKNLDLDRNVEAGRRLLEKGELLYGSYAPVPRTVSTLRWNEDPFSNLNWQWYHHQLISVHYLLAVDRKEHDPAAVDTAKQLVRSWAASNYTLPPPSPQSWNDHSTAYRLRTLLLLFEHLRTDTPVDADFLALLLQLIDSHCRVLAEESFFVRHTNHGLDQATILYWAASALPELADATVWRRLSLSRLREEVFFMFSPEGIHVENSPSYQVWMLGAIQELLLMSDDLQQADYEWILDDGWEYAAHALQPNGRFPLVGDTESLDFSKVRATRSFPGCLHYLYAATAGQAGTKPEHADGFFPLTGYAVFRDRWPDPGGFGDTVYLFFKCSFLSNYHRHDDDLNLVLFAFGEEWLIDSGLFGYEEDHPLRRHLLSPDAHNTVLVPGAKVIRDLSKLPAPGSRIVEYGVERGRSFVTGRSLMYENLVVERRLEYQKPHRIIIRDAVTPAGEGAHAPPPFTVLFHLMSDKQITVRSNRQVVAASTTGHRLLLEAEPVPHRIRVVSGPGDGKAGPVSWVSENITKITPSQCIRLEFQGTGGATCTLTLEPVPGETDRTRVP